MNAPLRPADCVPTRPALRWPGGKWRLAPWEQYACMPIADIRALPIGQLVGADSWLFLWATGPLLPEAIGCLTAWGFVYKSHLVWEKVFASGRPARGTGYIVRTQHEIVLLGAIGSPAYRKPLPSSFAGIRRQHSRKPDEFYDLVDATFLPAHARRADLFSRRTRPGWEAWGFEAAKFDEELLAAAGTSGRHPDAMMSPAALPPSLMHHGDGTRAAQEVLL